MTAKVYKIGEEVYVDGHSGFCHPSWEKIIDIKTRYQEDTGEPYQLVICGDQEYRADTGACVKGALAYFLTERTRP